MLDLRAKSKGQRAKSKEHYALRSMLYALCFTLISLQLTLLDARAQDHKGLVNGPAGVRIKDIARIHGIHDIQLYGYGIVVGLNGTGDSAGSTFTVQSVINMIRRFGIDLPTDRISVRNIAAAMVTADLPFFAKVGGRIDVLVSSMGDAKSIAGGTLLPTPLCASDGQLYVLAQGSVSVGGFSASAGAGNNVQKNHPTVGRVPSGGVVQKVTPHTGRAYKDYESFTLSLSEPDFTTAMRVVSAINNEFQNAAQSVDASSVKVTVPSSYSAGAFAGDYVTFISRVENLTVVPDHIAEVVIDERTGTIVVGKDVRISPVAVSHGNLSIQIKTEEKVSQPPPLSAGETVIVSEKDLAVREEKPEMQVMRGGASIDEVVRALNLLGVAPRDMIIIFQAIKKAGALHARLVTM